MPDNVVELYNTLDNASQQEVYDFIMFLVQKRKNDLENSQIEARKQKRLNALNEFAKSMKNVWSDIDILDYQKQIREERNFG